MYSYPLCFGPMEEILCLAHHVDELLRGFLLLAGKVDELAIIVLGQFVVFQDISVDISYIKVGGDG